MERIGIVAGGRYRITAQLGAGGMGEVYEAERIATGERFALKALPSELAAAPGAGRRFEREAKATSLLHHPNIVEVQAFGTLDDGAPYLVMELVRGRPLSAILDDEAAIAPRRALVLARQVLNALAYAHAQGIIHRDLKPENVMVTLAGREAARYEVVKLIDFGLVKLVGFAAADIGGGKLTASGALFGTPAYMAPEHALGRPVDARADLYSVGVMLYEMLIGRRPYEHDEPALLARMQVVEPLPRLAHAALAAPWRTAQMERLVEGALQKSAADRFPDAAAMIAALDEAFLSIDHLPPDPG